MQWDGTANAGFTTGKPWLAVNPNYKAINAADQMSDDGSVLSFYKRLIALRKSEKYHDTLVYGKVEPYLRGQKNLFASLTFNK
jgi:oligo-1,6-glucosidase